MGLDKIAILDFGAQYTQLIARRIREMSVYSEILPCTQPAAEVLAGGYQGIVLSGGPSSVYDDGAPLPDPSGTAARRVCAPTRPRVLTGTAT